MLVFECCKMKNCCHSKFTKILYIFSKMLKLYILILSNANFTALVLSKITGYLYQMGFLILDFDQMGL